MLQARRQLRVGYEMLSILKGVSDSGKAAKPEGVWVLSGFCWSKLFVHNELGDYLRCFKASTGTFEWPEDIGILGLREVRADDT